jgi:TIR domain
MRSRGKPGTPPKAGFKFALSTPLSTVFLSYTHADRRWRKRLEMHLHALAREGVLEVWNDDMIPPGDDWRKRIRRAVEGASVAILLVSAGFLTSKFIREEEIPMLLKRRQQQGLRIFPVICQPCTWKRVDWLASMLVRPSDGRPLSLRTFPQSEAVLAEIADEVYEAALTARPVTALI